MDIVTPPWSHNGTFSKELVLITDLGLEKFLIGSTIDELP
jgi:hypothetical protein